MKSSFVSFYILFCVIIGCTQQTEITINNRSPRLDTDGEIVDAHDGRVTKFGNIFFWYGTSYGDATGFLPGNVFRCYSSTDLMNWKNEGIILKNHPEGMYYRPHVVYNPKTRKYILWYNWYPELWDGKLGVAVSDDPQGPYEIVNDDVKVVHSGDGLGDFNLFIDDNGEAYLAYNTIEGHKMSIEKLDDDYLSSTFENGGIIAEGCEAGAIFKRNNIYYMLTDYTCCFCSQGSGVRVYTSDKPMSGYIFRGNINRYPGTLAPALTDHRKDPNLYATVYRQSDSVFSPIEIHFSAKTAIAGITIYQFTGNRNSTYCGDTTSRRLHEPIDIPTFKLAVKAGSEWIDVAVNTTVENTSIHNIVKLSFSPVTAKFIQLHVMPDYSYNHLYINELAFSNLKNEPVSSDVHVSAYINDVDPAKGPIIIPAQQTGVMPLETPDGIQYVWMGDLWGSASDNVKGHDWQYWGSPLQFDDNGNIDPLQWVDEWKVKLKK